MKTIKVIKSKKPKSKSRISKTKKPTQQQRQTQNVTVNVSAPRKRLYNTKVAIRKPIQPPITQGLPIRMNNPLQAPIIINKDTNQLSELIKSLQVKVNAEPPRVPNTLEKTKATPIETQTEEFDEQKEYNRLERASKKLSLAENLSPIFIENKPLSLLGETVTTDYPTFTNIGTQTATRSYRLGDLLRDSGQYQEVEDLYKERQQVLGRKSGPDVSSSVFSSNPATTSLLASVTGAPALEYVEPLKEKQEPPPLVVASPPPSLVSSVEESTTPIPEFIDSPRVEAAAVEEAPVEEVETRPPDEPPEETKQQDIPLGFGGTFEPIKGLEELNLPEKEKPVPSSLIEKPYLGGVVLPPIEAEGLAAVKVKQENVDLFPKQGQGLLTKTKTKGNVNPEVTGETKTKAQTKEATATYEKWKELNKVLKAKDYETRFRTGYPNDKGTTSQKSTEHYLIDIRSIEPNWSFS